MRQYLDDTFLRNATDILGDTDKGLKHNDSVNEVEIDFVVEITSIVMKLLIKLESKENLI